MSVLGRRDQLRVDPGGGGYFGPVVPREWTLKILGSIVGQTSVREDPESVSTLNTSFGLSADISGNLRLPWELPSGNRNRSDR